MKSLSFRPLPVLGAVLIAFGCLAVTEATAAQSVFFTKFQERLQALDVRGRSQAGPAGHQAPRPDLAIGTGLLPMQEEPLQLAQSDASYRVMELEEQVRMLNGRVEEMTFQLLQMQEQLRKMQEDNEFRFQELEDQSAVKGTNRGSAKTGDSSLGKSQPSESEVDSNSDGKRKTIEEILEGDLNFGKGAQLGAPPRSLGTLTFDENGNLIDTNVGQPLDLTRQTVLPEGMPETAEELFDLGYQYVQGGDYQQASRVFRQYVAEHPYGSRDAEARFWLGESLFAQGDYQSSARIFLDNHKAHPNGPLAAQNLLKLGVSLSGLEQRELACATFAEVPRKYPGLSNSMRKRVAVEQQAARCKNG